MRIGTSNSTKILDSACVNEYKEIIFIYNIKINTIKALALQVLYPFMLIKGLFNNSKGDGL